MVHKNEDISESVNSIDRGAIYLPRLGQDLSRNVFVVSILSFWGKLHGRIGFVHDTKNVKFSSIFEVSQK